MTFLLLFFIFILNSSFEKMSLPFILKLFFYVALNILKRNSLIFFIFNMPFEIEKLCLLKRRVVFEIKNKKLR